MAAQEYVFETQFNPERPDLQSGAKPRKYCELLKEDEALVRRSRADDNNCVRALLNQRTFLGTTLGILRLASVPHFCR